MQGSWPRNEFHYRISVSDDDKAPASRKRKFRDDYQMRVTGVWDVFRTCYCCDDRVRPIVDLDFKTTTFSNVEYRRFTVIEDDDIGVVDSMITQIGRVVNEGVKFEEVDEMVHRIRCVVDDGFRSGTEKLDLIVTVENQTPLPLEEYESLLWVIKEEEEQLPLNLKQN